VPRKAIQGVVAGAKPARGAAGEGEAGRDSHPCWEHVGVPSAAADDALVVAAVTAQRAAKLIKFLLHAAPAWCSSHTCCWRTYVYHRCVVAHQ
jgi:hypothetical protein